MLLDEEFMMWHCLNQFQDFYANQGIWCELRGLSNALLISKCCTACCPRGLTSASSISNYCTICYSSGLASASLISSCCTTCYLYGLGYATLMWDVACTFNSSLIKFNYLWANTWLNLIGGHKVQHWTKCI